MSRTFTAAVAGALAIVAIATGGSAYAQPPGAARVFAGAPAAGWIAPPGVHEVNFPTIDVGDPGKIAITFPGTTSTLGHKDLTRTWNSYVVVSTNALAANPLFLSNTANPKNDPVAPSANIQDVPGVVTPAAPWRCLRTPSDR